MSAIAVVFPGQGSQYVGMGQAFRDASPSARAVFETAESLSTLPIQRLCFQGPLEELTQTINLQPAVVAVDLACWLALKEAGIAPLAVAGHSLGEYPALVACGAISVEEALRLVSLRGRLMEREALSHPGAMSAVMGLSPDQVTIVGGAFGIAAISLMFLPVGWWSLVAVLAAQLGYVLDFSDGQVARVTGRSTTAGAYLDWLTHLYVPVGAVLATASSVAWATGWYPWLVFGTAAALELAIIPFSAKEHLLVAFQRRHPDISGWAPFHAALADDAKPVDVERAPDEPARPLPPGGISGRAHGHSLRSVLGELLIYPGAIHLLSVATIVDFAAADRLAVPARGLLLTGWAALLLVHAAIAIRRNHALITAIENRWSRRPGA